MAQIAKCNLDRLTHFKISNVKVDAQGVHIFRHVSKKIFHKEFLLGDYTNKQVAIIAAL